MTATTTTPTVEPAGRAPTGPRLHLRRELPAAYDAMTALSQVVYGTGPLEPSLVELLKIRVSQINGCAYCIDMHTRDARQAGETDLRMHLLGAWRETTAFTPRERAALALAEAVTLITQGHVPDEVWAEAQEHFDAHELAAVLWAAAAMNTWNRIAITTRAQPAGVGCRAPRRPGWRPGPPTCASGTGPAVRSSCPTPGTSPAPGPWSRPASRSWPRRAPVSWRRWGSPTAPRAPTWPTPCSPPWPASPARSTSR
jgi:AhpD family alkylhydroperoxidase